MSAALAVFVSAPALAQLRPVAGTDYAVEVLDDLYSGCPGPLDVLTRGSGGGVKQSFDVTLPFSFRFYDGAHSSLSLFSGGTIAFPQGQLLTINNTALGSSSAPNGLISPFWGDLELLSGNNGFLATSATGMAPDQEFCIEWHNFNDEQVNGALLNFKIVLHEGEGGEVEVHYGAPAGAVGSYQATMGMEDQSGGRVVHFGQTACSPRCDHSDFASLADKRVRVVGSQLDLVAQEILAPSFLVVGAARIVDIVVSSIDDQAVGPFDVEIRAADNPGMTGAVVVGSQSLALAPFQTARAPVQVTIPPSFSPGSRVYLELDVDVSDAIGEASEDNNRRVSATPTRLLQGGPDLIVDRLTVSSASLAPGGSAEVVARVRNGGSWPVVGGEVSAVLSSNPVISGRDAKLTTIRLDLEPGAGIDVRLPFVLPGDTRPGSYYMGVIADPNGLINELDEANNGKAASRQVLVEGAEIVILTRQLPQVILQQSYSAFVDVTGGSGTYVFDVVGSLPSGLGIVRSTGELYGRPSQLGSASFEVRVTDAMEASNQAEQRLSIDVVEIAEPLTVVTRDLPAAVVGQDYRFRLRAAGGRDSAAPLAWEGVRLPPGFRLDPTSGELNGIAEAVGRYPIEVSVAKGSAQGSRSLELTVVDSSRLHIVPEQPPVARLGEPYTAQLRSVGGQTPIAWIVAQGDPDGWGLGLSLDGKLAGTPNRAGTLRFVVRARDAAPLGGALIDETALELTILPDEGLAVITQSLPLAFVGQGYDRSVAASGGAPPYTWSLAKGRLPDGLVAVSFASANELRIAGTPTESAEANLLVEVEDTEGRRVVRTFRLEVRPVEVSILDEPGGCSAAGGRTTQVWPLLSPLGLWILIRRRGRQR